MSTFLELRSLSRQRATLSEQAGAILTKAHKEQRSLTNFEMEKFEKMHDDIEAMRIKCDEAAAAHQRSVNLELRQVRSDPRQAGREDMDSRGPGYQRRDTPPGGFDTSTSLEERQMFSRWLLGEGETRTLTVGSSSGGGATVPQGFVYNLEVALKYYGGILQAGSYMDTTTGIQMPWPIIDDTASSGEVIGENTTVANASGGGTIADPVYTPITFNSFMFDSGVVKISRQLLEDSAFDVFSYLSGPDGVLGTRIGRKLNNKCTVGVGTTEPKGIVTSAALGKTGASPTSITYAELVDLEYSLDKAYRKNASFMFHDTTEKAIKKLTDGNSRPLWIAGGVSEGIVNRTPDRLMGYPLYVNNDMAAMGSSNKSVLFGDMSKYKIRRVLDLQVQRLNELYAEKLLVGMIAYQRFDGQLLDDGTVHPCVYFINSAT